jgi:hypothetical protein
MPSEQNKTLLQLFTMSLWSPRYSGFVPEFPDRAPVVLSEISEDDPPRK